MKKTALLPLCAFLALITLTYANHFGNSFHFDDSHTVQENPYIRDLRNIPRIFTDADTFSTLPANRTWRPIVTASLAVDYWLGGYGAAARRVIFWDSAPTQNISSGDLWFDTTDGGLYVSWDDGTNQQWVGVLCCSFHPTRRPASVFSSGNGTAISG